MQSPKFSFRRMPAPAKLLGSLARQTSLALSERDNFDLGSGQQHIQIAQSISMIAC
jgi:hypothetical protein